MMEGPLTQLYISFVAHIKWSIKKIIHTFLKVNILNLFGIRGCNFTPPTDIFLFNKFNGVIGPNEFTCKPNLV